MLYYIILYYIILYYIILYYIILYYIILYYIMGPPSYMRSVVDRNVVMRRIPVPHYILYHMPSLLNIVKFKGLQCPNLQISALR